MAKPKASECARRAQEVYMTTTPPIPYVEGKESLNPAIGADCQGWVEAIIRDLGGKISYAGTNEMWRRAVVWAGTIAEAKAQGKLVPGCCPAIIKQDGKEPDKYKPGGSMYDPSKIGNCSHIGWYIGDKYEVIDASYTRKTVSPTTLKGFTHIFWLKEVDYSDAGSPVRPPSPQPENPNKEEPNMGTERLHWVILPMDKMGQTVNFRKSPDLKSNTIVLARLPAGTYVLAGDDFIENGKSWKLVKYKGLNGYVLSEFLQDISDSGYINNNGNISEDGFTPNQTDDEKAYDDNKHTNTGSLLSVEGRLMMIEDRLEKIERITGIDKH